MIRLLIVDDSASMRLFLEGVFSADPGIKVVGTAANGDEAIEAVARLAPDVITMDIYMPVMNGLDATRRIMETSPTPIVILSGNLDPEEVMTSFRAMEAGALVALPKPRGGRHEDREREVRSLVQTVKLMAEVKVVRRWPRSAGRVLVQEQPAGLSESGPAPPRVVAVGASTGGPVVIQTILSKLDREFPLPLLVVQHMAKGFVSGLADWLGLTSSLPVRLAVHGEAILPGRVYVAPDGCHLTVRTGGRIDLSAAPPENGLRPAASALFRSVADVYGRSAIGVLLTGMGSDGAAELLRMKEEGGVTIAQDKKSSVIFGMPGEAIRIGAATHVLDPAGIAAKLQELAEIRGA